MTTSDERLEKLKQIFNDKKKSGIILAIQLYGPLRLKLIAKIIGKSEATVLHHLKSLITSEIIILEPKLSAVGRGKYYVLSSWAEEYFEENIQAQIDNIPRVKEHLLELFQEENNYKQIAKRLIRGISHFELTSTINYNIQQFLLSFLKNLEQSVEDETLREEDLEDYFGTINSLIFSLNLDNLEYLDEFIQIINRFITDLHQLSEKSSDDREALENKQYIYLFTTPLKPSIGNK